ncbi:MAG: hypothetical protein CMJ58_14055 [Planctomycetaceae bacterium]|nr:hypothetical protein [Planctomycetaceae bacterium]
MHCRRPLLLLLVLAATWPASAAHGQLLEGIRTAAHSEPPADAEPQPRKKQRRWRTDCDDANNDDSLLGSLFGAAIAAPFVLPHVFFDDPFADRLESYAAQRGDVAFKTTDWFADSQACVLAARGQVDYGTNFDDVQSVNSKLQIDLPRLRATIDASVDNFFEDLADGGRDHLVLGDANLVFRFAQNERMAWRSGLGVNWLGDSHTDLGFNFTYGVDVLPREPFVFSTEIDLGTLGHSHLFRSRTTLGAQWRDLEVYAGYEYLDLRGADLSQMLFGVRLWW